MKIAVLSGKGGTGKTFVSVNLAACAPSALYLDCDVEEPNGHLFLKPEHIETETIHTLLPKFDETKCTHCRKCIDICRFNALAFLGNTPRLFPDVCHSCGGCALICPSHAVHEFKHPIGMIECGVHKHVQTVTGILNIGEASGVPIIQAVLDKITSQELVIIDCPPGSACTVMASVEEADYCILVAEPTAFGLHNLNMVYELVSLLKKPCGIILNKTEALHTPIDDFCTTHQLPILGRIPYREHLALLGAKAQIASELDASYQLIFKQLLQAVQREVTH